MPVVDAEGARVVAGVAAEEAIEETATVVVADRAIKPSGSSLSS